MIASLIYYGLYPLTQLFIRLSETWQKHHPVVINGTAVCDGGAPSYRRLNKQQTALLDQWCNSGPEASAQTQREKREAEGLLESRTLSEIRGVAVEQKSHIENDKEKIRLVDLKDPNREPEMDRKARFASECVRLPTVADEINLKSGFDEETLRLQEVVTENRSVSPFMPADEFSCHLNSYQATPASQPKHASSGTHDLLKSLQESQACTNGNESFDPIADGAEAEVQLTSGLYSSENVCGDDLGTRETEAQVHNAGVKYDLSALLADNHAQSFTDYTWLQPAPSFWHFPVGLGLPEVVQYPLQFSDSDSHGFHGSKNIEVNWRMWEDLSEAPSPCVSPHTACANPDSMFEFTVMSYNILAQDLLEANSELYAHCSAGILVWENRFQNILRELQCWEADIVCLQEVQENHFQEQLYPAMIEMGYDCVYKRRTGTKTDGCVVCYNTKRFTPLSVHLLEFQRHDAELLDRDNVGIVLLLQPIAAHGEAITLRPICVANTHLLYNPRRGDVKLAQLAIMLAEIDRMVKLYKVKGLDCEIILCGDFNSLPNTPLYQLIVTGQLYYHGLPNWMVSGQEDLSYKTHHRRLYAPLWPSSLGINDNCQYYSVSEPQSQQSAGRLQYNHDFLRQLHYCPAACIRPPDLELIPGVTDNTPTPEEPWAVPPRHFRNIIRHAFNLTSAYSQNMSGTECCAVTTLHSYSAAMVDYIFFSTRTGHAQDCDDKATGLKLLGRLALLSEADLWSMRGLPNEIFPSDHLSLLAKFQLG